MADRPAWVFVGGRRHGHELLKHLFDDGHGPSLAFILEEDAHELEKHSTEIAALPLLLPAIYLTAIHAPLFIEHRYTIPAQVLLWPLASAGAASIRRVTG